jgi:methionine-rich copper-binding protein CopC
MLHKYAAGIAVSLGLILASPAFADAALVDSSPARDSMIAAPRTIKLTFSEKIAAAGSGFRLSMDDGMMMDAVTKVSDDGKTLAGIPTSGFMKGKYTLNWHATAVDGGGRTEGSYSFTVK